MSEVKVRVQTYLIVQLQKKHIMRETVNFWTSYRPHITIHRIVLLVFVAGDRTQKNLKAQPLQIGSGWKSAGMFHLSNDGIGFLILRHTLKMAVMTSARICIRSQQRPPPASRAHVTSLARCIRYSPWSIVHSYLLFSYHYDLFFSSCKHNKEQESLAIAKMTARCALYIPISYSP